MPVVASPWHGHEHQWGPVSARARPQQPPWARHWGGSAVRAAAPAQSLLVPSDVSFPRHSASPRVLAIARPEPYPLLVLPGDAAQAGVELQVLLGCQLIKERVELGAVAQALLDLQELLQDAAGEDGEAMGRRNCFSGAPYCSLPLSHAFILEHHLPGNQQWVALAERQCHLPRTRAAESPRATWADSCCSVLGSPQADPIPSPPPGSPVPPDLCPLTKASPPVVLSSPVSILKVVVLPAPLTPSSPKHSPGRTPTHSRSTARMRPILRDLYTWWGKGWGLSLLGGAWDPQP